MDVFDGVLETDVSFDGGEPLQQEQGTSEPSTEESARSLTRSMRRSVSDHP